VSETYATCCSITTTTQQNAARNITSLFWPTTSTLLCVLRHTPAKSFLPRSPEQTKDCDSGRSGKIKEEWERKDWNPTVSYRRKPEPAVWTRRDNKRHVSVSVLTLTIQFLFMRNRFFVRSGREFWRGEKAFLDERKERQEQSCGKLFSFIPTLHTSCFKIPCLHSPSSLHAWVKAWYRRPRIIQADDNIATTTSSLRHGSYWPKISTVLYVPQLSELHTMLWMWSTEVRKFNATNFSHVFLYYNFLVLRISWWRICVVSVKPTVCGMRESLSSTRVPLLILDHVP